MVNALELTEELQARTDFSERDARGVVYAISRAVETATAKLVTSDQFEARMGELRAELRQEMAQLRAELKIEMAELRNEMHRDSAALRVELHQAIRTQTVWFATTVIAAVSLIIAADKLIP